MGWKWPTHATTGRLQVSCDVASESVEEACQRRALQRRHRERTTCDLRTRAFSCVLLFLNSTAFDTLTSGVLRVRKPPAQRTVASLSFGVVHSVVVLRVYAGRTWSHERVRIALQMRLYRPPRQQAQCRRTAILPDDRPSILLYSTCSAAAAAQPASCHEGKNAEPVLFLGGHGGFAPFLLPKRRPSRHGKVASNLVSILR